MAGLFYEQRHLLRKMLAFPDFQSVRNIRSLRTLIIRASRGCLKNRNSRLFLQKAAAVYFSIFKQALIA